MKEKKIFKTRNLILLKTIMIYDMYIPKGTVMNEEQWMNVTGRYGGFDLEIGSDKDFFKLYKKDRKGENDLLEKMNTLSSEISDLSKLYLSSNKIK